MLIERVALPTHDVAFPRERLAALILLISIKRSEADDLVKVRDGDAQDSTWLQFVNPVLHDLEQVRTLYVLEHMARTNLLDRSICERQELHIVICAPVPRCVSIDPSCAASKV